MCWRVPRGGRHRARGPTAHGNHPTVAVSVHPSEDAPPVALRGMVSLCDGQDASAAVWPLPSRT